MFSLKQLSFIISITLLFLLFSETALAQNKKIKKANASIPAQKVDTIKAYGFYTATAYFTGKSSVKMSSYSSSDLNTLMKLIDSASRPGRQCNKDQ